MQKILFAICFTALLSNAAVAQNSTTYPVVVSFGSMCCGVPSDEPVIKLIKSFKKQYKIKQIAVDNIGPMGREGEYYLAFRLKEFSKAQKIKFIQQLKKTAATMKEQGYAEIKENETVSKADLSSKTISVLKF
ncbi:MAG: hypothetical protein IPN43_15245 [Chitinophagaceae bacterium]|nr:hypothetical protein [Chitinophagaceae bacterium]MBK8787805.1 hypothetical protein [Chitinophagaceae bacterium]MBL0201649.1 hypothetical protein [Chitinophagaceae bacterium]